MHLILKALTALLAILLAAATVALAQERENIPQELLEADFQDCSQSCPTEFGEACQRLCRCVVNEYQKRLPFDHYLDLRAQLAQQSLSEGNRLLLDGIANFCTKQTYPEGGTPQRQN